MGFRFTFEAAQLDERNWVYDFGNCGWIKKYLEIEFDHRLVVAEDDPHLEWIRGLPDIADINVVKDTGCEKFAEKVYNYVQPKVYEDTKGRVNLYSVEVFEHGANSAVYINPYGSSVIYQCLFGSKNKDGVGFLNERISKWIVFPWERSTGAM